MRIGIAQINTMPGVFEQTVGRMVAQSQRAAEQGVELLVFPLAALAGVDAVPYADMMSFMRDVADAVAQLCEQLACPALVPVPMDFDGQYGAFDALLINAGEVRPLRMLSQLKGPSPQPGEENREGARFEFGGLRCAVAFSHEDLNALVMASAPTDAIIFLSGYPFALDDPSSVLGADLDNARFVTDAQTSHAWLVGVGPVGGYGDQVFSGSSMVLAPSGEVVALAPPFEESLLVADIGSSSSDRPAEPLAAEVYDAPFSLWQAIMLGLNDYVQKHGYTDVALCLDGTLGSCVLAAVASDALGPLHVHAVVGASAGERAAACRDLAHRLRIDAVTALGQLPGYDARDCDELELANVARAHHALALSSLDKTALALGVRIGEVNVASLCPLGDVYRSDVLDMAHMRNTISPVFRRVDLTEADALPLLMRDGSTRLVSGEADITRLDEILLGYVEYDRPLAELVAEAPEDQELIDAVIRTVRSGALLRCASAPVLAMSTHTLEDVQFPLSVHWHDEHLDQLFEGVAPFTQAVEKRVEPKPEPAVSRSLSHMGMDLDATISMLRDLMEQGGFVPTDLTPITGDAMGEGPSPKVQAWMLPFSEN